MSNSKPMRMNPVGMMTVLLLFASVSPANAQVIRAVWMYHFEDLNNATEVRMLSKININHVFLSVHPTKLEPLPVIDEGLPATEPDADYINKLRNFIVLAHFAGISVHAMVLQSPEFALAGQHSAGLNRIGLILQYNKHHRDAAFDGIHIDTEPHTLRNGAPFRWWSSGEAPEKERWARNEVIMQQFLDLLRKIHSAIELHEGVTGRQLAFSAAIAWWFNEKSKEEIDGAKKLPSGAAAKLAKYLDMLVPMVYDGKNGPLPGSDLSELTWRTQDEIDTAPTIIGIQAEEFEVPPVPFTIRGLVYPDIVALIDELATQFAGDPNYRGVAVFKYERLKTYFLRTVVR